MATIKQELKLLKIPTKYKHLFEPDKKVTIITTRRRPRMVVLKGKNND